MTTRGLVEETEFRWRQFEELPRMRMHWEWRKGWAPGRRSYWWFVDLVDDQSLTDLARHYLDALGLDCFDPAPNLHISVQQVGFTDQVSVAAVDRLLDLVRSGPARPPVTLRFGPVDPNPESIVLRVSPWESLRDYRIALRRHAAGVVHPVPGDDDHFWPHVSIGYANTEAETAPIARALRELPAWSSTVTVREIALVELNRDDRLWSWTRIGAVPLRAPDRAAGPR